MDADSIRHFDISDMNYGSMPSAARVSPSPPAQIPKTAGRPVAEFLFHLTRMLTDVSNHHLIEWDAGRIVVHDPPRMETEVLAKYFRHSKYSSFQRQLNYFGFRKISGKGKMSPCSYVNDAATADLGCLLRIRRKTATKALERREQEAKAAAAAAKKSKSTKLKSGKSKKSKSKSASSKRKKSKHSSSTRKSNSTKVRTVTEEHIIEGPASTAANAWAPPAFGGELVHFDPFVVSAEEYGPPGTVPSQVTPSTSASSSSTNLSALGAETLCLPPPANTNATSALESSFREALDAQQSAQQQEISELQQPQKTSSPKFSVPNPLMSVPNPLSSPALSSPTSVASTPPSMPSPATAAMYAASKAGGNNGNAKDLSSGFPVQPSLSREAAPQTTVSAHQAIRNMLSTTIPSASALFSTDDLTALTGSGMLSPNSSLVNLAMLPTM